jgi:hypothetical protein
MTATITLKVIKIITGYVKNAIVLHLKKLDMEKAYIKNFISQRKDNKKNDFKKR